jgi:hypothetical protein
VKGLPTKTLPLAIVFRDNHPIAMKETRLFDVGSLFCAHS